MDVQRQLKLIRKEVMRLDAFLNRIQVGSGTTDASGDATVSFPNPYPSAPFVFLQAVDAAARGIVLDVVSKSAMGFTVKARKVTGLPTDTAIKDVHYYTASAVTSISATTGSGGVSHSHDYSGSSTTGVPSATTAVMDGYYYTSVVTGVDANTGGPSATTNFHGILTVATCTAQAAGAPAGAIAITGYALNYPFPTTAHTHTIGKTTGDYGITGPSTAYVASSGHTHGFSWSGTTGTASAYLHAHPSSTVATASFVTSLTLLPEDYLTVVVGDPVTLEVDFDFLALLR